MGDLPLGTAQAITPWLRGESCDVVSTPVVPLKVRVADWGWTVQLESEHADGLEARGSSSGVFGSDADFVVLDCPKARYIVLTVKTADGTVRMRLPTSGKKSPK